MERFEIFTICRRPPVLQTDARAGMIKIVVRETEATPKLYALPSRELLFLSCPHGHQFVVREAVYKW